MSRKPDYRVGYLNKKTDEKGSVGGAWKNDDGTITITLNTQVVIQGCKDVILTLFPEKSKPKNEDS